MHTAQCPASNVADTHVAAVFTQQDYGIASGMFALGYGIAHLPSTFVTMRLGARWWYSSLTVAWGIVATCGALITDRSGLCIQRFMLGVAEAGKSEGLIAN